MYLRSILCIMKYCIKWLSTKIQPKYRDNICTKYICYFILKVIVNHHVILLIFHKHFNNLRKIRKTVF